VRFPAAAAAAGVRKIECWLVLVGGRVFMDEGRVSSGVRRATGSKARCLLPAGSSTSHPTSLRVGPGHWQYSFAHTDSLDSDSQRYGEDESV